MWENSEVDEEFEVECGDCGGAYRLVEYQNHTCLSEETSQVDTPMASEGLSQDLPSGSTSKARLPRKESEDNIVSRLVEAVHARPPLWDHTIQLRNRTKDIKEKLWRQVYNEIDQVIPLDQLEKKWRNLRDTFLKHFKMYTPSGSGTDDKKKWKHFDILFFLAEKNSGKRTISNASVDIPEDLLSPTSSEAGEVRDETPSLACYNKRQKKKEETEQLLLNILKEPAGPPKPEPKVSPALMTINSVLEKLPERIRMQAEIDMLNKVYSLYAEYGSE